MKNVVIGVGNVLFKDEGIGIYALKYLEKNYDFFGDIEFVDGGTLGFKLMSYFQEYDNVIILDTVSIEDEAGSIFSLPSEALLDLGTYRKTAHEVEIVEMLEICSVLDKYAKVLVLGIIPDDILSVEIGLSKALEQSYPNLVNEALKEIEKLGISIKKKSSSSIRQTVLDFMGSYNGEHRDRVPRNEAS